MRHTYDLSQLDWTLTGWTPNVWRLHKTLGVENFPLAEVKPIKATVPGSVQGSLRDAGLLPDWNVGLNSRQCDWVENRHWVYSVRIPDEMIQAGKICRLNCLGLDYTGCIVLNNVEIAAFTGCLVPHVFDLTRHLRESGNILQIVFECAPRWLGFCDYSSRIKEWKPRFNYTWDWTPRLVQIGIWDKIELEITDNVAISNLRCAADADLVLGKGVIRVCADVPDAQGASIRLELSKNGSTLETLNLDPAWVKAGYAWEVPDVGLWWPNLSGQQPLYNLVCHFIDCDGTCQDSASRQIGFKSVRWEPCDGAPVGADPWICVVNGKPTFLQGINWTPIRPNFADVTVDDYRIRLEIYRDLGFNMMRVWGGAFLEKECFYDICDELGLLVWQEFPLCSSGIDNWPPEDEQSIEEMAEIAKSYIERRQHHASLAVWCGGNELQGGHDGGKVGQGRPVDGTQAMLVRLREVVEEEDPGRRFIHTSASGPRFTAVESNYGKGEHWDVHGPWKLDHTETNWENYWAMDDSLFRSETGCPAASPVEIIRRYAGEYECMPASESNPYWCHSSSWWIEWETFLEKVGREPMDLEEYVTWSQERQAYGLTVAVRACKDRFPGCGGILIWMGHDSFPCAVGTSIIDFEGNPKPAAEALRHVLVGELPQEAVVRQTEVLIPAK